MGGFCFGIRGGFLAASDLHLDAFSTVKMTNGFPAEIRFFPEILLYLLYQDFRKGGALWEVITKKIFTDN